MLGSGLDNRITMVFPWFEGFHGITEFDGFAGAYGLFNFHGFSGHIISWAVATRKSRYAYEVESGF